METWRDFRVAGSPGNVCCGIAQGSNYPRIFILFGFLAGLCSAVGPRCGPETSMY